MPRITDADREFFRENGYLVVQNVVPPRECEAVIAALFTFLGMDPDDPDDWYRPPLTPGGMLELYQHQTLWNNRQNPDVYQVFAEILNEPRLWVTIDRANFKPPFRPDHPEYDHKGFIHWDVDTSKLPCTHGLQGVLYLRDTGENMGGFQCIPGFHKDLEAWIATQPADRSPFMPDLNALPPGMRPVPIPGEQGDLVIWDRLLAHGNGRNLSDRPRFCQYISMFPANRGDEAMRADRVRRWRERLNPDASWAPGDPRRWESLHGTTAELTPLGRKLLGLDAWEGQGEGQPDGPPERL